MTMLQKINRLIPFIILLILLSLLGYNLFYSKPNEIPSALIGETIPPFQLPELLQPQKIFTQKDLLGQVALLNVWATWCYACKIEHPFLMQIKHQYHIPIYSILYKDNSQASKRWLREQGNPYVMIGDDHHGDVAIDFGVYGTPETFIINPQGKIIYRHVGALNQTVWNNVLYPLIKKYQGRQ